MTEGRSEAARLLIAKGADNRSRDGDGRTVGTLFVQNDTDVLFQHESELVSSLIDVMAT